MATTRPRSILTGTIVVTVDPTVLPGVAAAVGIIAIFSDPSNPTVYGCWQKIGSGNTAWAVVDPGRKSDTIMWNLFSGNPLKYAVVFDTPFPVGADYAVHVTGSADARTWTYESMSNLGFTINSNAATLLTGKVSWTAELSEETA